MATNNKRKTTSSSSRGRKKPAKKQAAPIRREVGACVCLVLALLTVLCCFRIDAAILNLLGSVFRGLIGAGFYILPFSFVMSFLILILHDGRPVALRVTCTFLTAALVGSLVQLVGGSFDAPEGWEVVTALWDGGISGTAQAAVIAAGELTEKYPARKIVTIDTYAASLGEGLQVLEAARMIEEGKSLDEIKAHLLARRPHMCQFFTVDDLAYLKRGGRISSATALIGTVLSIKPILCGDETGHIVSCGKVRGMKRAYQELANYYDGRALDKSEMLGIAHADNEEGAQALIALLRDKGFTGECLNVVYEPVTGAHVGPGTVALFFYGKEK